MRALVGTPVATAVLADWLAADGSRTAGSRVAGRRVRNKTRVRLWPRRSTGEKADRANQGKRSFHAREHIHT